MNSAALNFFNYTLVLYKWNWGVIPGKKLQKNREIVVGWTLQGREHKDSWLEAPIGASPRTKYKRLKNVFAVTSIALTSERLTQLLQLPAQSLSGSPGTLVELKRIKVCVRFVREIVRESVDSVWYHEISRNVFTHHCSVGRPTKYAWIRIKELDFLYYSSWFIIIELPDDFCFGRVGFERCRVGTWMKIRGTKLHQKSRNSCRIIAGGLGAYGQVTQGANWRQS